MTRSVAEMAKGEEEGKSKWKSQFQDGIRCLSCVDRISKPKHICWHFIKSFYCCSTNEKFNCSKSSICEARLSSCEWATSEWEGEREWWRSDSASDFEGWAYRLFYVSKINLILFVLLLLRSWRTGSIKFIFRKALSLRRCMEIAT